jgi:hypothetical protein
VSQPRWRSIKTLSGEKFADGEYTSNNSTRAETHSGALLLSGPPPIGQKGERQRAVTYHRMCSVSARAAGVHTRTHTYTVSGDDGRGALLSSVSPLPLSFPWASPRILSLDVVSPPTRISRCISSASRIISDRPRSPLTRRRSRRTSPRDPVLTHVYTHIHTCTGTHRSPYEAPTTVAVADAEGTPDSRRAGYTPRSNATAGSRTRAGHRRRYLHRGCSDLASAAFPRRPRRVDTDESFPFLPHCAPPLSVLPVPPFVRTLHARHRRLTAHTPGIPARLCVRARVCVCVCVYPPLSARKHKRDRH